jgi:hypothetical protein
MCSAPALVGKEVGAGTRVRNVREVEKPACELPRVASNAIRQMKPLIELAIDPVEKVDLIVVDNHVTRE